jgi:plastocyanin
MDTNLRAHVSLNFSGVSRSLFRWFAAAILAAGLADVRAVGADFTVTSPGYYYTINGTGVNPNLTLVRGKTYTFQINASSIHPFFINSSGVQNNDISNGTITYTVPAAASNYTYYCSNHRFGGTVFTVAPTPPPVPNIHLLSLSLGNNVVLRSLGTNNWSVVPEYSTNLAATNWYALTVITNLYSGGTNETICGRPPANPAFIRIKSQPN